MTIASEHETLLTMRIKIRPEARADFIEWQSQYHLKIAEVKGFVSLEIRSPNEASQSNWVFVQRFKDADTLLVWQNSVARAELIEKLKPFLTENGFYEIDSSVSQIQGVTEVFVTQVSPEKEDLYREWIAKIHKAEAKFPGFKGAYIQSPSGKNQNWITFLQFDSTENLDRWLTSDERKVVLNESVSLITSLESHRVITPFGGWFSSLVDERGPPSAWKQTMLILLVLFPIVMLEFKYLNPITANLNPSLGMFIGNAISVTLLAWPFVPMAIFVLSWWLSPKNRMYSIFGTILILLLYLIEIAVFW